MKNKSYVFKETEKPTTITVGELKKSLERIPDNVEVLFDIPPKLKEIPKNDGINADGFGIKEIKFQNKTSISPDYISISPSGPFWW